MTGITMLYSTFPTKEAAVSVTRALLERRLAACANIIESVTSLYRWEGEVQQEQEVVLMAKTSEDRVEAAIVLIKSLHPYELPCIVAYPIEYGAAPFVQWVKDETA